MRIIDFIVLCLILYAWGSFNSKPKKCLRVEKRTSINYQKKVFAWVTVYHPTVKECGSDKNITNSGLSGKLGMCAVSQKLFDYNINMFDTVCVLYGTFKGKYIVTDKAGSNVLLIDIWRPIDDSLKDCYKTKVLIKTRR